MAAESHLLAHQFTDLRQQHEAQSIGMWVFLATEALIFAALFTGYMAYRITYPQAFEAASARLNILIGAVNTVVLLTSSLTMALSVHAAQVGRRRRLMVCLGLTALLGLAFMLLKAREYYTDYQEKLIPGWSFDAAQWDQAGVDPRQVQLFLVFYYVMTLLHAVHLTVGIGLLLALLGLAWRGYFTPQRYMGVELSGLYWHFVDVVWIFLLPILYLIGTHTPGQLWQGL